MAARARSVGLVVAQVDADSPAHAAGIEPGDIVVSVDGAPVPDELAFRYHAATARPRITIRRGDDERTVRLPFDGDGPTGIEFADLLGDGIHTCNNRCVFCFIHQMPRKMRRSLYLMDDDYRLSFVHGNYITLTNMSDAEFDRIVEQRLSPLYVSVHATDPDLRGRLLGRRDSAPIMPRLQWLTERGTDVHAQIVLCPGINDDEALDRTIHDLASLHPRQTGRRTGVLSVAVVPVGLTRYRDRLAELRPPDRSYAIGMIREARRWHGRLSDTLGTRFVWLSDEWYYLAGRPIPGSRHYEGFPQLEDGVGTTRLFLDDLAAVCRTLPSNAPIPRVGHVVTGELAAGPLAAMCDRFNSVNGIRLRPLVVRNDWFGGTISVAGLLTGADIAGALGRDNGPGEVFVPDICLKDGELFLDDVTVADLERTIGRPVRVVGSRPRALACMLGLTRRQSVG